LNKLLPAKAKIAQVQHHAAMPFAELPAFMERLREQSGTAARALEFIVLTAARTSEVLLAKRSEIDLDARMWTVIQNSTAAKSSSAFGHFLATDLSISAGRLVRLAVSIVMVTR
jgi:integrase